MKVTFFCLCPLKIRSLERSIETLLHVAVDHSAEHAHNTFLGEMSIEFNSNHLVSEILEADPMPLAAVVALKAIGLHVRMHCLTVDRKTFTFQILSKELPDGCAYLTLRLIKGSFHTVLWSTFARFDDEYVLYYHLHLEDLRNCFDKVYPVWSIRGVDAVNAKISLGLIDWFLLRKIQSSIKIDSIGVLAFTKLLGRFLFSVPNYIKTRKYLPPMPATFMFNYLTVVCYCPFELSVTALPDFLNQPPDPATGTSMKVIRLLCPATHKRSHLSSLHRLVARFRCCCRL